MRAEDHAAHVRTHSVGADDEVEALAPPRAGGGVLEQDADVRSAVVDLDGSRGEAHRDGLARPVRADALPERGLDVAADHRRRVARLVQEPQARLKVPVPVQRPGLPAAGRVAGVQVVADAEVGGGLSAFGHEADEVAAPAAIRGLLHDDRLPSGLPQPDRRGHAGDAEPDHQCAFRHDVPSFLR